MGKKNVFLIITILVFLIVADVINADFSWKVRKLTAPSPKENPNTTVSPKENPNSKVSPNPSPVSENKQTTPVGGEDKTKQEPVKEKENKQQSPVEDKSKDNKAKSETGLSSPPPAPKGDTKPSKEDGVKEQKESKDESPTTATTGGGEVENCDGAGIVKRCQDTKSMIACVKSFDDVSKAMVLLIMNQGDSNLKVDLTVPSRNNQKVDVPKHQTKKVNLVLANNGGSNEITLNSGSGNCVLHLGGAPALEGNYFQWVPSYAKFMTPVYGAYFFLAMSFLVGSVWACCWFRKRKTQSDIPYQELELSRPESAAVVDSAEGWDQVWDDDWDEENAVKSPGGRNISANGLTSRTPKKDGWEDWDD